MRANSSLSTTLPGHAEAQASSQARTPAGLQTSPQAELASVLPLPDNGPAIRARLPLATHAGPNPAGIELREHSDHPANPDDAGHTAMQVATEPALVVLAPRAVDPELYEQLPTHEQAAAVNQRWLALQSAPAVDDTKRRHASTLIEGLLKLLGVPASRVDREALLQSCLSGIDIGCAIRLSKWLGRYEAPLNADEIAGCATAGLEGSRGAQVLRLYRAMHLPLRADTAPFVWKKDGFATMSFLSKGSYNETSILNIEGKQYVFKPDPGRVSPAHVNAPAFASRMNCSANNLAASRLDEALGWKTICKVRLAAGDYKGELRLGILMDFVQGKAVTTGKWHDMGHDNQTELNKILKRLGQPGSQQRRQAWISRLVTDRLVGVAKDDGVLIVLPDQSTGRMTAAAASQPGLIVAMLRKQAVDWIIGDLDSSSGNYLFDAISTTITSFDKDFTFPTRAAFEGNYCWEGDLPAFWRNMGVPPYLDHASHIDVQRLRDRLPELLSGLLTPEAIHACLARINMLLCFTQTASVDELAAMDWRKPPGAGSLNGSTLLWRDVYRFG